jgi:hypothetical protein
LDQSITPPYFVDPFKAGSTCDSRLPVGMNPLPAASGAAGKPRKMYVALIADVHCFQELSRLAVLPGVYWQGGLL